MKIRVIEQEVDSTFGNYRTVLVPTRILGSVLLNHEIFGVGFPSEVHLGAQLDVIGLQIYQRDVRTLISVLTPSRDRHELGPRMAVVYEKGMKNRKELKKNRGLR